MEEPNMYQTKDVDNLQIRFNPLFTHGYFIVPPPSVMGEVYCFPRRQLIFSFGRRVINHLKGLWEYIPKLFASVCTTIFKRIAGLCFYLKSSMLYINGFVLTISTNKWKAFFQISNYASPSSGKAYKDRQLTTNFEFWVEIFCVPTKPCLSVRLSVHLSVPRENKSP